MRLTEINNQSQKNNSRYSSQRFKKTLQEELKAEGADVAVIDKAAGFAITKEDLKAHRQALSGSEHSLNILTNCKNIFLLM